MDKTNLDGQCVLLTGGASGLGLSSAKAILQAGGRVVIADIHPQPPQTMQGLENQAGVKYVQCDVSSWESQLRLFQEASNFAGTDGLLGVALFAGIDNKPNLVDVVQASGAVPQKPDISTFDINLTGVLFTSSLALHYMRPGPEGGRPDKSIIFVSSVAGYMDVTRNTVYRASKFGVRGLFRAVRDDAYDQFGIRVNSIAPWVMRTPMTAEREKEMLSRGVSEGKGVSYATHETLVGAVLRLLTDKTIRGRAYAIMPEGAIDLGDDQEGSHGGPIMKQLVERRAADGDFVENMK